VSIGAVLQRLQSALEAAGIPYMVTGSFASSAHGMPRATNDIDIVIAPTEEQLTALLEQLPEAEYYSNPEEATDALRRRSQFNIIDYDGMWKIDFIIRKERPFSHLELTRRAIIEIAGVRVYSASPEDILIVKLEWAKSGDSQKQIEDAAGIIRVQEADLDIPYVERWVAALALEPQWRAARERAR
jgi:hypothetical protein